MNLKGVFAPLAAAALLSACFEPETVAVSIVPYNHTGTYIDAVYVDGVWGGNVFEHTGGGSFVCCAVLPARYQPGLTVKVSWEIDGKPFERVVPVPPYAKEGPGLFNVHFLRGGEVRVITSQYGLRHPNYPLKGDEAKLEP